MTGLTVHLFLFYSRIWFLVVSQQKARNRNERHKRTLQLRLYPELNHEDERRYSMHLYCQNISDIFTARICG